MAVVWTECSHDDLVDIFRFIARDNRKAAERWTARLVEQAEFAATTPFGGRVVPDRRLRLDDIEEE